MGNVTGPAFEGVDSAVTGGQDNSGIDAVDSSIDCAADLVYTGLTMNNTTNITEVLDAKIKELEREAQELQRTIQRLNAVNMNLSALRQTRDLLAGTGEADIQNGNGSSPAPASEVPSRIVPGSIGALALEAMREAGKPMHVKELLTKVHAKGKPDVAMTTLVSTLCNYANSGKIKRPAPSTYALVGA